MTLREYFQACLESDAPELDTPDGVMLTLIAAHGNVLGTTTQLSEANLSLPPDDFVKRINVPITHRMLSVIRTCEDA